MRLTLPADLLGPYVAVTILYWILALIVIVVEGSENLSRTRVQSSR